MKIGLFVGSFDPFHVGHKLIVEACLDKVDKVIVIPTAQNPWKESKPLDIDSRIRIINAFIGMYDGNVIVSDIEKTIEPPYYTYKTINGIIKEYTVDNEYFIICGYDVAQNIHKWYNFETEIFPKCSFLVVDRDNLLNGRDEFTISCNDTDKVAEIVHLSGNTSISSTQIREMLHKGIIPYDLLSEEAIKIILTNHYYVS